MRDEKYLKEGLLKFINKDYSVEDLSRFLSWVGVSKDLQYCVNELEYKLEEIRFLVSDDEQYKTALVLVNDLLLKIEGC